MTKEGDKTTNTRSGDKLINLRIINVNPNLKSDLDHFFYANQHWSLGKSYIGYFKESVLMTQPLLEASCKPITARKTVLIV